MIPFRSLFFALTLMFTSASLGAQGLDVHAQRAYTSDRIWINQSSLQYTSQKRDALWAHPEQQVDELGYQGRIRHMEFLGPNLSFIAQDAIAGADLFFGPEQRLAISAGLTQIQQRSRDNSERGLLLASFQKSWQQTQFLEVNAQRGFLLPQLVPLAGNPQDFYGFSLQGRLLRRFADNYEVSARYHLMNLDVQNHLQKFDIQLMYALSRFPRWILFGLGGEQMSWQRTTTSYWSPRVFRSVGPRVDLNFPLLAKWSAFLGGSYNFFRENSFRPGEGFYGRGGFNWGQRGEPLVSLFYEKIQSTQNGNLWEQDSAGLTFEYPW